MTTIYVDSTIIAAVSSLTAPGGRGSTATGGMSPASSAAVATSATASLTSFIPTGAASGAASTGGSFTMTYISTIVSGQTLVEASTIYSNGSGNGSFATGGIYTPYVTSIIVSGTTLVETLSTLVSGQITSQSATGGIYPPSVFPYNTTVTISTIVLNGSTTYEMSVYTTGFQTGGYISPSIASTVAESSGANGSGSGTGGVIAATATLPGISPSSGAITTLTSTVNGSTVVITQTLTLTGLNTTGTGTEGINSTTFPRHGYSLPLLHIHPSSKHRHPHHSPHIYGSTSNSYPFLNVSSSAYSSTTSNKTSTQPYNVTTSMLGIYSSASPSCVTITSVSISTYTVTQTPSTCVCGTIPILSLPLYTFATASTIPSSTPSSTPTAYGGFKPLREEGQPATDQQIAWACSNVGNQVFNGGFELTNATDADAAQGWSFTSDEPSSVMYFTDVDVGTADQHTPNGSQLGRVTANDQTATGRLFQPLTLCPNTTYQFGIWTRQEDELAECVATFEIASTVIGIVEPETSWTNNIFDAANYTVGPGSQDGAVDLSIILSCLGDTVSDTSPGIVDFDDVSVTAILS